MVGIFLGGVTIHFACLVAVILTPFRQEKKISDGIKEEQIERYLKR